MGQHRTDRPTVSYSVLDPRDAFSCVAGSATPSLAARDQLDLRLLLRFWNHLSYPMWTKLEEAVWTGRGQGTMELSGEHLFGGSRGDTGSARQGPHNRL